MKTFEMKWNGVKLALLALVFAGIFAFTAVSFAAGGGMGGGGGMGQERVAWGIWFRRRSGHRFRFRHGFWVWATGWVQARVPEWVQVRELAWIWFRRRSGHRFRLRHGFGYGRWDGCNRKEDGLRPGCGGRHGFRSGRRDRHGLRPGCWYGSWHGSRNGARFRDDGHGNGNGASRL